MLLQHPPAAKPNRPSRIRTISLFTATSIVVSNMVGNGIFTSLGFQVASLPSGFVVLLLWAIGGVCALCGALAYAELAAAFPKSGGEYRFLSEIFHPAVGFLAGWISATVGFSAPIALAAMALGTYGHAAAPFLNPLALSLLVVWICSAVHFSGVRRGSAFQNIFTVFKIALLAAFILVGLFAPHPQTVSFIPKPGDWDLIKTSSFAVSLVFVMYAYSGWNASTYIVGELRDPQRNVLRSVFFGTLLVTGLYLAVNAIFLRAAPMSEMATAALHDKPNVASIAAAHLIGDAGSRIVDALICLSLLSTISSMVWIGPSVSVAMGEDLRPLRFLAIRTRSGIPRVALIVQLVIVNLLLVTTTFQEVTEAIMLAITLCSFATVGGLIVLRIRRPDLPRPYRAWGYPVTPIIFLVVTLWMMIHILCDKPKASLMGLSTMFLGLIVYFASRSHDRANSLADEIPTEG